MVDFLKKMIPMYTVVFTENSVRAFCHDQKVDFYFSLKHSHEDEAKKSFLSHLAALTKPHPCALTRPKVTADITGVRENREFLARVITAALKEFAGQSYLIDGKQMTLIKQP